MELSDALKWLTLSTPLYYFPVLNESIVRLATRRFSNEKNRVESIDFIILPHIGYFHHPAAGIRANIWLDIE